MTHRLAKARAGVDMEALSPRDANAQRPSKKAEATKTKTAAQLRAAIDKEHPPPPPPSLPEPSAPDRPDGAVYQVGSLLGKGGFAICYRAQLATSRDTYALKIVKSRMPPKMEQKFQTELQIHSKMRHRNVVQFFRAFSFDACTYLVLELCNNGSLMDMVRRRKGVTEPEVRYYAVQIAGAIKYMHGKGIIHRDLKMGNIFLDARMNAKIGDFGLAALLVTGRDMQTIRRTTLCGTPNYIAPEILEKGKMGHDHMVDIWSLGIIMFAMLTSKPPFQSSTTDEIYRRARERDYEWPTLDSSRKLISQEAKDLVASMLQDADCRPDPDLIVQHPFFTSGYMPAESDLSPRLLELPPERNEFYAGQLTTSTQAQSYRNLKELCRGCCVGPWTHVQLIHTQIWKEMAAEEKAGLTPMIPLAENTVYRPFDDWLKEQRRTRTRHASSMLPYSGHPALATNDDDTSLATTKAKKVTATTSSSSSSSATSSSAAAAAAAVTVSSVHSAAMHQAPLGLLRQPPQSFAAQQRSQSVRHAPATARPKPLAEAPAHPSRGQPGRHGTAARHRINTGEEEAAVPVAGSYGSTRSSTRSALPSARSAPSLQLAEGKSSDPVSGPRRGAAEAPAAAAATAAAAPLHRRHHSDTIRPATLFGPSEKAEPLAATKPEIILNRLRKLQTELERALNARTMAIISSKTVTPPHPHIVAKWVDYTNKFGLGYILNNGGVGCILRDIPTTEGSRTAMLPPAGVFISGAERHFLRRDDETYADRNQPIPMLEPVRFFENQGEDGLVRVSVSPDHFRVAVSDDGGVAAKMSPGKDIFEHRKRERIILWKKFANYMVAYGRDEAIAPVEPPAADRPTRGGPSDGGLGTEAELVTFYQRFGDVGCWVFCDGHLQFNFPDHTKIVLDATGSWCHFWHLPQEAAQMLAATGVMGASALDNRAILSYPLQTLLNFQSKASSSTLSSSSSSTTRRRPEIEPSLRGIPAANDFRRKVEFIRDVVREWVANGGMGNSAMSRQARLCWKGFRETAKATTPEKHVWVTIGARWGDQRLSTYVDPLQPWKLGDEAESVAASTRRGRG